MDHFRLPPHEITNKTVVNDYTFSSSSFAQSVCAAILFSHSRGFFRVVDLLFLMRIKSLVALDLRI